MTLSWGIAATGTIARRVGAIIAGHPQMQVAAVGSRDLGRATALATELGAARAHGSYRALVEDPDVQAVYVATPHPHHAEVVEMALSAGRAVLCEKPLTPSLAETERLVALAREAGVFLMEGMWMRFNPLVQELQTLVADGALGEVRSLHASFGFQAEYDPHHVFWDPASGGGLLDIGIYAVDFARLLLGSAELLQTKGSLAPTGADAEASLLMSWSSGARALLDVSLLTRLPGTGTVIGSHGWAELSPGFHAPTRLIVDIRGADRYERTIEDRTAGFVGELDDVASCLAQGRTESTVMPLEESVATMRVLTQARAQLAGSPIAACNWAPRP